MNIEEYREHCLSKRCVTEEFPFDQNTLVFKVSGKMFALTNVDSFQFINLKCDPEYASELREKYGGVRPGYHMNKKNWNSVYLNDDVPDQLILKWIDDSYDLVVETLPKKDRETILKQQ